MPGAKVKYQHIQGTIQVVQLTGLDERNKYFKSLTIQHGSLEPCKRGIYLAKLPSSEPRDNGTCPNSHIEQITEVTS